MCCVVWPDGASYTPPTISLDHLESWSRNADPNVRYFSDIATYKKQIVVPPSVLSKNARIMLDLGAVKNLAEVSLNGELVAVPWKAPFTLDVTHSLRTGSNLIEIKVTNLWPNRLIGDQNLPPEKRITWTTFNPYSASSPLLESGLFGRLVLRVCEVVQIP